MVLRTTIERLKRGRVQIQDKNSFFAYLSLFLKFEDGTEHLNQVGGGASINHNGTFQYNEDFFQRLDEEEVEGVIVHEILHLVFLHLTRRGNRDPEIWNIACDFCVNQIIKDARYTERERPMYKLPPDCVVSNSENKYEFKTIKGNFWIEDIDKKSAEELYDEIVTKLPEVDMNQFMDANGFNRKRFDKHIESVAGKKLSEKEKRKLEKKWKERVAEAVANSRQRGDLPQGIERIIGKLHEEKIDWRDLLKRYIQAFLPYDYTYQRPNKKSVAMGVYTPDYLKEKIEIVVGIDLSGSIGQKDLNDFLSEVIGMARAYRNRIVMNLLTHEVAVNDRYIVDNGDIAKIKQLKLHGGGGTSHKDIFDVIREEHRDCKVAVFLTDGYSDIDEINMEEYPYAKIFAISERGEDDQINQDQAMVVHLGDKK